MCGIAGWIGPSTVQVELSTLEAMAFRLRHRGPDDQGIIIQDVGPWRLGLAHRRLAIIDLSASQQPMLSDDGKLAITFNGEIYNFADLRIQLINLGANFRTKGDTEVLLAAYQHWGVNCLSRLHGMFAFAIADLQAGSMFLARDPFGEKPLMLVEHEGGLGFASEAKALFCLPGVERRLDLDGLALHQMFRYVPGPTTLFAGVSKLQPGHAALWEGGRLRTFRYFDPAASAVGSCARNSSEEDVLEKFDGLLQKAVGRRTIADVPFGAFLSGGLDSSVVVALMQRSCRERVKTFSIGFTEGDDELPYAEAVARHIGTDHHPIRLAADTILNDLPLLTRFREAPISEPADAPIYRMSREASEVVKVVLGGEGSDEIFAGYPKHSAERFVPAYQALVPELGHKVIMAILDKLPLPLTRLRTALGAMGIRGTEARMAAWFGAPGVGRISDASLDNSSDRIARLERLFDATPLRRVLDFDQTVWLPDNLLERGDRMTMAASVELRAPYLDTDLTSFVAMLPPSRYLIRNGRSKWILRQVAAKYLPPIAIERPKNGFRVPVGRWLRSRWRDYAADLLLSPSAKASMVFGRTEMKLAFHDHLTRRRDNAKLIWWLLTLEIFLNEYELL